MVSGAHIFVAASVLAATTLAATPWFELSRVGHVRVTAWSSTSDKAFDLKPHALFEVHDPGRFLANSPVFARVRVPRYWTLSPHNATVDDEGIRWSTVDVDRCNPDAWEGITYECHRDRIVEATECTPTDPNGCAVDIRLVSDAFVEVIHLRHAKGYLVATNLREFTVQRSYFEGIVDRKVNTTFTQRTPSTGVFRVRLALKSTMVIGVTVVEGLTAVDSVQALSPKPLHFENPISMEAVKEPHRVFVLHLSEDGSAVIRHAP